MRPPILGSLLHAALVVGSAAQPRPPAQHARPSLHDPLLVDPGGVAAEHEHGLRPHHSSGATAEDPLLFRHRYQHHDAASDRLVYYQYEAKRHPHVVVLEDIGVHKCEASSAAIRGEQNVTEIVLVVSNQSGAGQLPAGAIVSGSDMHCVFRDADGTVSPWRKTLRDRVLSATATAAPHYPASAVEVTLQTVEAALNEVFEHAQVEYFHGRPHNLDPSRRKRLDSLAKSGTEPAAYEFASSAQVVTEVKQAAVAARRKLASEGREGQNIEAREKPAELEAAVMVAGATTSSVRPLAKSLSESWHAENVTRHVASDNVSALFFSCADDFELEVEVGAICSNYEPGPIMNNQGCGWETMVNGVAKIALKAGNTYKIKWAGGPTDGGHVKIYLQEVDMLSSSVCTNDLVVPSSYHPIGSGFTNDYTFVMPDLDDAGCAVDWLSFPEFQIVVETVYGYGYDYYGYDGYDYHGSDCHKSSWPPSPHPPFVLLDTYSKGAEFEVYPEPSTVAFGDEILGASIECTNCYLSGTADVHVLVRVDDINPFAETWSWGSADLEGHVDLSLRAWMQVDEYFSKGSVLSRPACVPGLCAGTLMAGLDITVGVFIDLEMSAYIDIDAQAELVYNRRLEATGTFGMHTLGLAVNFHKSDFRLELNQDRGADPDAFDASVSARTWVSMTPVLYCGAFASIGASYVGLSAVADAYLKATVRLYLLVNFDYEFSFENRLAPLASDWCGETVLGCNEACFEWHNTKLWASAQLRLDLHYKLYASAQ